MEYFVETLHRMLCVIHRSRVLRVVCPHQGYRSATPLVTTVYLVRVNRVMLWSLCSIVVYFVFCVFCYVLLEIICC